MKRYIQSSTLVQSFNDDPFSAFGKFLNQSASVSGFDEDGTTFSVYCKCNADQLSKEFVAYMNDPDKVKIETGYDEDTDESYRAVVIRPTSSRWRKILLEFANVDAVYEDDENVWVDIQDVF